METRDLNAYAQRLAALRDEAIAYARRNAEGEASAYRLALDVLAIWSDGKHGAKLAEQPSPFDVTPA